MFDIMDHSLTHLILMIQINSISKNRIHYESPKASEIEADIKNKLILTLRTNAMKIAESEISRLPKIHLEKIKLVWDNPRLI